MKYDIFVSYSTKDKAFADALVNRLEANELRCWYAPRDIPGGVSWPAAITEAIKEAGVMLLIFSESANNSAEVSKELTLASSHRRMVIPVRIQNVSPSAELEYHLTNRHWLDVYGLALEEALSLVLDSIKNGETGLREDRSKDSKRPALFGKKTLAWLCLAVILLAGGIGAWRHFSENSIVEYQGLKISGSAKTFFGPQGVSASIAPVGRDGEGRALYLLQFVNTGNRWDQNIFLCSVELVRDQERFVTSIDGERYVPLVLFENSGMLFPSGYPSPYSLTYDEKESLALDPGRMLMDYARQEEGGGRD